MKIFKSLLLFLLLLSTSLQAQSVWPGDVNNNGLVNEIDLLYLGAGYGEMGPARKSKSAEWTEQFVTQLWATSLIGDLDLAYADCDGDGEVDDEDIDAINDNFKLMHTSVVFEPDLVPEGIPGVSPSFSVLSDDMSIRPDATTKQATKVIEIGLGDSLIAVDELLGIAFFIKMDPETFNVDSTKFDFGGWLPMENARMIQRVADDGVPSTGEYVVAYTKTNKVATSNEKGPIGTITVKTNSVVIEDLEDFKISIDSIILFDADLNKVPVFGTSVTFMPEGFRDTTNVAESICQGEMFTFNNSNLTIAGEYRDTLTNSLGNDSLIILNLGVNDTLQSSMEQTICAGESYDFNGQMLTVAGEYRDTLTAANGCDEYVLLNLEVLDTTQTVIESSICAGDSYFFNNQDLTVKGTYRDTLTNANGCDRFIVLELEVRDTTQTVIESTICDGEMYVFNGQNLTVKGTYRDTLTAANNCDRYIILNLEVLETTETIVQNTICAGETYSFKNQNLTETGIYRDTLTAANGCNRYMILDLEVLDTAVTQLEQSICAGENFSFNGQNLTTAGIYTNVQSTTNGCDSTIRLNLVVEGLQETELEEKICEGTSFNFNGVALVTSGIYRDTLVGVNGCDSFLLLNLEVSNSLEISRQETICAGSSLSFNGQNISEKGIYKATYTASNGCDSLITLNLVVTQPTETMIEQVICIGSSTQFNNQTLTETGVYYDTLSTANGCDSIIMMDLKVLDAFETLADTVICEGESINFHGFLLTSPNTYRVTLGAANGCDSTVILTVDIAQPALTAMDSTICGEDGMVFNGNLLTVEGTYYDTLSTAFGCDSLIQLNLSVLSSCSVGFQDPLLASIKIYPNPVNDRLVIASPDVALNAIELINVTGQRIWTKTISNPSLTEKEIIDLQPYTAGLYWVVIHTEYGVKQEMIVKIDK